jgi:hypothetical protein
VAGPKGRCLATFQNSFTGLDLAIVGINCNDIPGDKGYVKKEIMFNKSISPLVITFLVIGSLVLVFRNFLQGHGIDWQVLSGGNLFIYVVTIVSMHLLSRGLYAENTYSFLRFAYSGILLKLFACAAAAFIYIFIARTHINKGALFITMGLYLVYTFIEMWVLMKQSKHRKNG